jgi:SWI/SNF-related matrix-associated actin-dependent regulator of chromatin subfamily A-like protein 1
MTLYGETPPDKRERHIRCFQNKPKYRVIICNIQAAGTAITLTAAHQVAFAEVSWVPAENAQAAMRVHRIGQTHPVTVRFFGLAGSSDEQVARVLRRKTRDLTAIFDETAPEEAVAHNPFD